MLVDWTISSRCHAVSNQEGVPLEGGFGLGNFPLVGACGQVGRSSTRPHIHPSMSPCGALSRDPNGARMGGGCGCATRLEETDIVVAKEKKMSGGEERA